MDNISLSVFFPAYNEEQNIEALIKDATKVLSKLVKEYEIIIVNDGSKDKTVELVTSLQKTNPHLRLVNHEVNQGYGAAVWSGIQAARYDWVFFSDADRQFDLSEIKKLLKFIPEYNVVLGYRAKRKDPFIRLLNAWGWNILNRLLFGLKVKDIDCAFKLFKRSVIQHLEIKSRGAMMSAELLLRLQRSGIPFRQVPVTHLPRKKGAPTGAKPSVILRAFRELITLYLGDQGTVTQRQVIKFMIVGILNTILDLVLYYLQTRYIPFFKDHLVGAKIISYGTGSITGFLMNRRWTFKQSGSIKIQELTRFYATVIAALIINSGTLFILVHKLQVHDLVAALIATFTSFSWNFVISKFWVFSHRKEVTHVTT